MNNETNLNKETNVQMSKRPYIFAITLSLILVVTIISTSYAFFTASVTGTGNNTVITSGNMAIDFTDGPEVGLNGALPGQYVEKTFSVTNTGTVDTYYDIYLSDLLNNFADKTDLVYTLTSNNGGQSISQTVMPDISTKIVSNKMLPVGTTHNYTLRVDFLETNTNQDDNKGKTFSTVIRINEVQEHSAPYTVVSGDLNTVGSVVKIADEEFYVIGQEDSTHVKLFAKYNLGVGNGFETPTNKQESTATGYGSVGSSPYAGTVAFSSTNYWHEGSTVSSIYGESYPAYVYDSNASIKTYVDDYVTYLNNQGVSVSGRLIKLEELIALGCDDSLGYCDASHGATAPEWVTSSSYWVGTAASYDYVRVVHSFGDFSSNQYNNNYDNGVRPVIILEK